MSNQYRCENCNWKGSKDEIILDTVETCMGNDKVETCPVCFGFQIVPII